MSSPKVGIDGYAGRAKPILEMRKLFGSKYGKQMKFIFPVVGRGWEEMFPSPASYASVREKLTNFAIAWNIPGGSELTLHSPRNFLPTVGSQADLPREARARLGHWAPTFCMPERYDRNACVSELRVRAQLLTLLASGWKPTLPFEVPPPRGAEGSGPKGSSWTAAVRQVPIAGGSGPSGHSSTSEQKSSSSSNTSDTPSE